MKVKWPNSKFLLPAGLFPPAITINDFVVFEDLRAGKFSQTDQIAQGYEYYYMLEHDPQSVNNSVIGGKIFGVHGPFLRIKEIPKLYPKLLSRLMFRPPVAQSSPEGCIKTIEFAHRVGAHYVVLHTSELDLTAPEKFTEDLQSLCKKLKIVLYLEPEGADLLEVVAKGKPERWQYDALELFKKFKNPVVFDPATVEWNGQELISTWKEIENNSSGNIRKIIGHVHLNEYIPGFNRDHGVMKSPQYAQLIKLIDDCGYEGFFTFEQDAIQSQLDLAVAGAYGMASFLRLPKMIPALADLYTSKTQRYLFDSVKFTENVLLENDKSKRKRRI